MKIVVVSDSHSNYSVLEEILNKNYDADTFFHLGDSELPEYMLNSFTCVKGNCDYTDFARERDVKLNGYKIHLEHGNSYNFLVNTTDYIQSKDCDIFLFGHTHRCFAKRIGKTYVFNPGSITRPRDGDKGTYLVINLIKDQEITWEFKTLED